MKHEVEIASWMLGKHFIQGYSCLYGVPKNHTSPWVSNVKLIATSPVVRVDLKRRLVETENTLYRLVGPGITVAKAVEMLRALGVVASPSQLGTNSYH